MTLQSRSFQEGDYETYIADLTKAHMREYFLKYFGGWSNAVSKKRFFRCVEEGTVKLFFLQDDFVGYFTELNGVLEDVHVVDAFQGKGYGTEMLQDPALQKDLEVLVFVTNPALRFYERNAFVKTSFDEGSQSFCLHRKP